MRTLPARVEKWNDPKHNVSAQFDCNSEYAHTKLEPYARFSLVPERETKNEAEDEGQEPVPIKEVGDEDDDDSNAYNNEPDVKEHLLAGTAQGKPAGASREGRCSEAFCEVVDDKEIVVRSVHHGAKDLEQVCVHWDSKSEHEEEGDPECE